jgi:anti-sigma28 factor (negative regulator of flagellin synthesis)
VGLSTGAAAAPAVESNAAAFAESREDKIARLSEQYRKGTYETNADAISAKLVESLLE